MKLSIKILTLFLCFFSELCFSNESIINNRLYDTLSDFKIKASYTNSFNLFDINEYSQNTYGANLEIEHTILSEFLTNTDLGLYAKASFQNFVPDNIQLIKLTGYGFSGGIFTQWNIRNDISFNSSLGTGFLISDINFISAEKGKINDIYYDFLLEGNFSARKTILKTKYFNLDGNTDFHIAFYNEKSNSFINMGPAFGLIINFKPCTKIVK